MMMSQSFLFPKSSSLMSVLCDHQTKLPGCQRNKKMDPHDDDDDDDNDEEGSQWKNEIKYHDDIWYGEIIACGYKSVYIPKSQLSFPAWLVMFSSRRQSNHHQSNSCNNNNNKKKRNTIDSDRMKNGDDWFLSSSSSSSTPNCKYYWRSKRDFLRLSRAVLKYDSNLSFPRSTFRKLSNQSPWNIMNQNVNGCSSTTSSSTSTSSTSSMPIPSSSENQWQPFMKKSLFQLNQYLEQITEQIIVREEEEEIRKHNNNNNDTTAAATATTTEEDDKEKDSYYFLCKAWNEFCRPYDCNSMIIENDDTMMKQDMSQVRNNNNNSTTNLSIPIVSIGNDLGQYYCHVQIAKQLVRCCLDKLWLQQKQQQEEEEEQSLSSSSTKTSTTPFQSLVFVEPSCGHGQVIETLLHVFHHHQQHQQQRKEEYYDSNSNRYNFPFRIIGIDLDQAAINHCSKKFKKDDNLDDDDDNNIHGGDDNSNENLNKKKKMRKSNFVQNGNNKSNDRINQQQQMINTLSSEPTTMTTTTTRTISDPLQISSVTTAITSRSSTSHHRSHRSRIPVKCITTNFLHSRRKDTINDTENVVVLGGPPYTIGAGKCQFQTQQQPRKKKNHTNNKRNNSITDSNDKNNNNNKCRNEKQSHFTSPTTIDKESIERQQQKQSSSSYNNDLPLRFVRHAIMEYRASVVAFIMPQRCAKIPYHEMLEQINEIPTTTTTTTRTSSSRTTYDYETIQLEGPSIFYFQGQHDKAVHQPSIIQAFWRKQQKLNMTTTKQN